MQFLVLALSGLLAFSNTVNADAKATSVERGFSGSPAERVGNFVLDQHKRRNAGAVGNPSSPEHNLGRREPYPTPQEIRAQLDIPKDGIFFYTHGTGKLAAAIAPQHLMDVHGQTDSKKNILAQMWKNEAWIRPEWASDLGFWRVVSTELARVANEESDEVHISAQGDPKKEKDHFAGKDSVLNQNELPQLTKPKLLRINPETGAEAVIPNPGDADSSVQPAPDALPKVEPSVPEPDTAPKGPEPGIH